MFVVFVYRHNHLTSISTWTICLCPSWTETWTWNTMLDHWLHQLKEQVDVKMMKKKNNFLMQRLWPVSSAVVDVKKAVEVNNVIIT